MFTSVLLGEECNIAMHRIIYTRGAGRLSDLSVQVWVSVMLRKNIQLQIIHEVQHDQRVEIVRMRQCSHIVHISFLNDLR
jgi:hypothetical protein